MNMKKSPEASIWTSGLRNQSESEVYCLLPTGQLDFFALIRSTRRLHLHPWACSRRRWSLPCFDASRCAHASRTCLGVPQRRRRCCSASKRTPVAPQSAISWPRSCGPRRRCQRSFRTHRPRRHRVCLSDLHANAKSSARVRWPRPHGVAIGVSTRVGRRAMEVVGRASPERGGLLVLSLRTANTGWVMQKPPLSSGR